MLTAAVDRILAEEVPAAPGTVRDHYVDLNNIKDVHPLVESVRVLVRDDTPDGYVQVYQVRDRIPIGPLTLPVSYTARLEVPREGPVTAQARQFPGVRLDSVVSFDPVPAGTRLTERIRISAPRPLLGITVRQAVAAHTEMLAGIRRYFAAAEPG